MPTWALTLSYVLHLAGTVVWVGGLAALALFTTPAAQRVNDPGSRQALLARVQGQIDRLGWFAIALMTATGLFQLEASPHYRGFLAISGTWSLAILLKHLTFAVMVALSAYLTWGLAPAQARAAFRQARGLPAEELDRLQARQRRLAAANLVLATLVLVFTAVARTA